MIEQDMRAHGSWQVNTPALHISTSLAWDSIILHSTLIFFVLQKIYQKGFLTCQIYLNPLQINTFQVLMHISDPNLLKIRKITLKEVDSIII